MKPYNFEHVLYDLMIFDVAMTSFNRLLVGQSNKHGFWTCASIFEREDKVE